MEQLKGKVFQPYTSRSFEEIIPIIVCSIRYMNVDMLVKLASTSKSAPKKKDIKYAFNTQFRFLAI